MTVWLATPMLLMEYRHHPERWNELACHDGQDSEGRWRDTHASARYRLLITLQYHHQIEDKNLVHFLFQQEVARHQQEPFQGYLPSLELATYLLALFPQVEHVWDFYAAKTANFDTYCGYSAIPLVSSGINETLTYIRATVHPRQKDVQKLLMHKRECIYNEGDLRQWWEQQSTKFPQAETEETAETMVGRAMSLEDMDAARYWLVQWRETSPATSSTRYYQVQCYSWLKDWDAAVSVQKERIEAEAESKYSRVTNWCGLADLYRESDNIQRAWQAVQEAQRAAGELSTWLNSGIPRSLLITGLLIAKAALHDAALRTEIFQWAMNLLQRGCTSSWQVLQLAEEIAIHCEDVEALHWLEQHEEVEVKRFLAPEIRDTWREVRDDLRSRKQEKK